MTPEIEKRLKPIVIANIRTIPDDIFISLGNQEYSPKDLEKHVEESDETGIEFMKMHWQYLRDAAAGTLYGHE